MIELSKLDKAPIIVSLETIKYIESIPDTLIHFLNGDSLIVRESMSDIVEKALEFKLKMISNPTPSEPI